MKRTNLAHVYIVILLTRQEMLQIQHQLVMYRGCLNFSSLKDQMSMYSSCSAWSSINVKKYMLNLNKPSLFRPNSQFCSIKKEIPILSTYLKVIIQYELWLYWLKNIQDHFPSWNWSLIFLSRKFEKSVICLSLFLA